MSLICLVENLKRLIRSFTLKTGNEAKNCPRFPDFSHSPT
jgi:hypothetical protein